MSKIHFPQFGNRDYSPFEMRQLVQALELRFQTLESEIQPSTFDRSAFSSDELANLYAPLNHQHVVADITDFPTTVFFFDDVSGSPDDGDTLVWSGGSFVAQPGASGGAIELDDLSDVIADSATDGQTLVFDASTLRWRAEDQASSGIDTLFELLDTDLSGQGQYDLLFNADGDEWQETGTNFQWVDDSYIQLGNDIAINWYDESFLSRELLILKPTVVTVVPDPLSSEVQFFTDFESVDNADAGTGTMTELSQNATVSAILDGEIDFETGVNKFGSRSAYFTPTTSAPINFGDEAYFSLATNDWTMQCWVRFEPGNLPSDSVLGGSGGGGHGLISKWLDAGTRREYAFLLNDDDQIQFEWSTTGGNAFLWRTDTLTWVADQWYFLAMVREGGQLRAYRDGVQIPAAVGVDTIGVSDSIHNSDRALLIGSRVLAGTNSWHAWGCYFDEVLLTVGTARYDADFTPPAVTYADGVSVSVDRTFIVGDPAIDTTIDGATTTITGDGVVDGDTTLNSFLTAQGDATFNAAITANSTTDFNGSVEVNNGNTFSILEAGNIARVDISHTGTALGFTGTGTTTELDLTNLNLNLGLQAYYAASVGDKVSFFDNRLGATNMYGIGVESSALYFKTDSIYRWYVGANADGGASDVMELTANDWTLTANALVGTGHYLRVQDSTNADYWQVLHDGTNSVVSTNAGNVNYAPAGGRVNLIAGTALWIFDGTTSDTGQFSHNGTDFLTTFTNTVDWDVTGLSGEAFFDADLRVSGDLTVGGTTTTINSNVVSIADNIIVLNSDEAGAPTQDAGIEVERGTSANVFLQYNETTDRWEFTNDGTTYQNILLDSDLTSTGYVQAGVDETITGAWTFDSTSGIDSNTNLGRTADLPLVTFTTVADWANRGIGTAEFLNLSSTGAPTTNRFFLNQIGNRDTLGGYAYMAYGQSTQEEIYYGYSPDSSSFPTWIRIPTVASDVGISGDWTFSGVTAVTRTSVGGPTGSSFRIEASNPQFSIVNDTAAADTGAWNWFVGTSSYDLRLMSDDFNTAVDALEITRSGTTPAAWTFTGTTFDFSNTVSIDGSLRAIRTSGNGSIEVGNETVASTAFIDFHSSGNANDYDARISVINGTTQGTGDASITAASFDVNAQLRTATLSGRTANGPLNIYGGSGNTGANIELYGSTHPSQANNAFHDSASHQFRAIAGASTYATFNAAAFTSNNRIIAGEKIRAPYGVGGQYSVDGGDATWGGTIYGMGMSFTGPVSGNNSANTSLYGLKWLRASHTNADSRVSEGMYVFQNGALQGGFGASGIYTTGNVNALGVVIVGSSDARQIQVPTLRGTINVGGAADNGGVGLYHGYSINNDIMFMHNGTSAGIYDEINDDWKIRFDTNVTNVALYSAGIQRFTTQPGSVNIHSDGNTDAETRLLRYTYQNGTSRAVLGYDGTTELIVRNQVHGAALSLQGEDAGGTVRNLLSADPDGVAVLYINGSESFRTDANGIRVRDISGSTPQVNFVNSSNTAYGQVANDGANFYVFNQVNGGNVQLIGRDAGSNNTLVFQGDPDAEAALYYDGAQVARTHTVGMEVAGTNSFYGLYDSGFTTRTAFLQSLTVLGDLILRNEVAGENLQLEGTDAGSTVRSFMEADPDGAVTLHENFVHESAMATQGRSGDNSTCVQIRHRSGGFYDVGMNVMPQIAINANLTIDPSDIGGYFYHNNTTNYTITLNNSADIPVGGRFDIIKRGGTGTITISQGTGVTITKFDGTTTITTGNIVIAASTVAWLTVHKYDATNFFVTGAGLP